MDVQINEISTQIGVIDERALLTPRVLEIIKAEVRKQREEDDRLNAQRNADRSADTRGRR